MGELSDGRATIFFAFSPASLIGEQQLVCFFTASHLWRESNDYFAFSPPSLIGEQQLFCFFSAVSDRRATIILLFLCCLWRESNNYFAFSLPPLMGEQQLFCFFSAFSDGRATTILLYLCRLWRESNNYFVVCPNQMGVMAMVQSYIQSRKLLSFVRRAIL